MMGKDRIHVYVYKFLELPMLDCWFYNFVWNDAIDSKFRNWCTLFVAHNATSEAICKKQALKVKSLELKYWLDAWLKKNVKAPKNYGDQG